MRLLSVSTITFTFLSVITAFGLPIPVLEEEEGGFRLSEKGEGSLEKLKEFAELQSFGRNYLKNSKKSTPEISSVGMERHRLVTMVTDIEETGYSAFIFIDDEETELTVSVINDADALLYFNAANSKLVPYDRPIVENIGNDTFASYDNLPEVKLAATLATIAGVVFTILGPIVGAIIATIPGLIVNVLGHALSGPLAALFGAEQKNAGFNVKVITFDSPNFGDIGMAIQMDILFNNSLTYSNLAQGKLSGYIQVVHENDIVPDLPSTELGYTRSGLEVFIRGNDSSASSENVVVCPVNNYNCV